EYLLSETDWDIWGLTRWSDPVDNLQGLASRINAGDRIHLVEGDLTDVSSLYKVVIQVEPHYVFHLAAQSYVQASFDMPAMTLQTNLIGTSNLLEAIRRHAPGALVHNCSSSEVYGQVSSKLIPIKEDCPFHATSPYSASKIGADVLGQYYAEAHGLWVLTTRMFTHTGPRRGDVFAESSFAKQIAMIEVGQLNPPIKVGNLDSLRTVADVRDAVRAYYMLLTQDPIAGEVYNIGGTHVCTVGQILDILFDISGCSYPFEIDKARLRPLDATSQVPDCTKFMTHTTWQPEISFRQTMVDLLEYWRERVKLGLVLQR
ncbi:hypothetical protein LCGC14_1600020, partial [marine sediment metagenome]